MTTFDELWPKFQSGKEYREAFVAQQAKQAIGFQIQALLEQYDVTQTELAKRAGLTQGVVSRAADPSYGSLTLNTCIRIAAGFDVAFIGRFVPFSELPKWFDRLYAEPFTVASFEDENASLTPIQTGSVSTVSGSLPLASISTAENILPFYSALPEIRLQPRKPPQKARIDKTTGEWTNPPMKEGANA